MAEEIDRIQDTYGGKLKVAVDGPIVKLQTTGGVAVYLGADERDQFAKAYAEAERRAEANHG